MGMSIIEAKKQTRALLRAGNAALWSSGSGLGKSSVAYQLFEEIRDEGAKKGEAWGFLTFFAATQQPTDMVGVQFKGERTYQYADPVSGELKERTITISDPALPVWMMSSEGKPAFMYDKCFLLIDEYGQGELDTKRSIAEVFLNGGVNPWYLPAGSVRLACTNQGARYGVSKDFDFAISRRFQLEIVGDLDVSMTYMDKPYWHQGRQWVTLPVTKLWAKQHPETLFEEEPKVQGPWCNPRQLMAVDRFIQSSWEISNDQEITSEMTSVIAGGIGMPATESLLGHFQFLLELPQYEEVIKDPQGTPVPTKADLMMLMAYQLAAFTKVEDLAPVIEYIQRLPKDMGVTYVTSLLRRDYRGLINSPPMQAWISKNAALVSIISALAQTN
jgi:hypothetical protein